MRSSIMVKVIVCFTCCFGVDIKGKEYLKWTKQLKRRDYDGSAKINVL